MSDLFNNIARQAHILGSMAWSYRLDLTRIALRVTPEEYEQLKQEITPSVFVCSVTGLTTDFVDLRMGGVLVLPHEGPANDVSNTHPFLSRRKSDTGLAPRPLSGDIDDTRAPKLRTT